MTGTSMHLANASTATLSRSRRTLLLGCLAATLVAGAVGIGSVIHGLVASGVPTVFGDHVTESMVIVVGGTPDAPNFSTAPTALDLALGIAGSIAIAALCALAIVLVIRLLRGRPFSRSLTRATIVIGGLLIVGGGVDAVAQPRADLAPAVIVGGLLLVLIGLAFAHGTRLADETEGLV